MSKVRFSNNDLCYLFLDRKDNICDSNGRYSCEKLQTVCNQAEKSGNKVALKRAIELKNILECGY